MKLSAAAEADLADILDYGIVQFSKSKSTISDKTYKDLQAGKMAKGGLAKKAKRK